MRHIDRRWIITRMPLALLAVPGAAHAQRKVYRVAHLSGSGAAASKPFTAAFRDGMRALGYVEGQNLVLEERYAEGKLDTLPALAKDLVRTQPDLVLAATTPGNVAAKAATSTIPIVMVLVADPVGAGIVSNVAHPGGNITGITNIVAELGGKRIELLKQIIPSLTRVAALVNTDSPNAAPQLRNAQDGARALGIELRSIPVRSAEELPRAFDAAAKAGAGAAIRMIDPLVFMLRKQTAELAATHRLPVIYPSREDAEAGGLIAYGTDVAEQFRQAATLVDKLLRGAKPGDLPIEQPTKFELVVNQRAAKALGLTIPPALLLRADQVIT
jgi:putative tryptophan/tyrosine transport system substrate-binding protein